jgi:Copper type II ascorbate-dependent monooxygenase, C-terminal domain
VVEYPAGMGVPIRKTDKVVVQMHYNLADVGAATHSDSTALHLRFAPSVTRQLAFLLPDPFLESLEKEAPDSLPPQKASTTYTWTLKGRDVGVAGIPSVDLVAVMPHMHGRGVSQRLRLGPANDLACAAELDHWNFHWQEFYFYKTPPKITPDTQIELTCEYSTLNDLQPVLPGWGTRNEMCLAVMMVALPPS